MAKSRSLFAIAVLTGALFVGGQASAAENARGTREFAAQTVRRPHIVIRPRRLEPGPNSKRICRFRLGQEYRVSGPVIVPQQYCWWN